MRTQLFIENFEIELNAKCINKDNISNLIISVRDTGRGIKAEDWYIINQDRIPAVLVEGGFMDNTYDYKIITSDAGQTAYAKSVAEGLIEFLGLEKKSQSTEPNVPFTVKVDIDDLNIRKGPGINYAKTGLKTGKGVFTIVEVKNGSGSKTGWGKLKSGTG